MANVSVTNTTGLYQLSSSVKVLTNAQQLLNLLSNSGNVNFALDPTYANTKVEAFSIVSAGSTYSNANVAAFLPINSANVNASYFTGNGAFLTGIVAGTTYSNANVAAYLAAGTDPTISAINANITAANASISSLTANAATQETEITGLRANITAANTAIVLVQSNLTAFSTYANATFSTGGGGSYGNANVAAYLPTYTGSLSNSSTIVAINANITAANAQIQTLSANIGAYEAYANANLGTATTNITTLFSNAATQATAINSINANVTAANATIQTISANLGAYETWANGRISTLDANLGTATTNITTLFSNAATQATQINTINANVAAANAVIATLQTQVYSNANVASYLPTYSGNLNPGNVVISGNLTVNGTTTSVNFNEYVAGLLVANATTTSTSTTTGALQVKGGAGIVGNVVAGAVYTNSFLYANGQAYAGTYTNSNVTNLLGGGTYTGDIQALSGVVTASAINSTGALSATTYVQAGQGLYSISTFTGSYSDGIVVDYTTGNGRISVGTADALTFYAGGPGTTPTAVIYPNGNVVSVGSTTAANLITTAGVYWANGVSFLSGISGTYSNSNVSAYLASGTDTTINAINANVTAANAKIQTLNANVGAYETWANATFATTSALSSYTPLTTFNTLNANVGAYETWANATFLTGTSSTLSNVTFTNYKETITSLGSVSGNINVNANLGSVWTVTATGAITLSSSTVSNIQTGQSFTVIVTQDGTGGRILTSNFLYAGGNKTLSTGPGAVDVINVFYNGSSYLASLVKGYQ